MFIDVDLAAPVTHQDLGHFVENPYRLRRPRKSSVPYRAQSIVTNLMVMNKSLVVHAMGSKNVVRTIIHEWEELPIKSCGFSNPISRSAFHSCKEFLMAERDLSLHDPVGGPSQFMSQGIMSHHSVRFQCFFLCSIFWHRDHSVLIAQQLRRKPKQGTCFRSFCSPCPLICRCCSIGLSLFYSKTHNVLLWKSGLWDLFPA